MTPIVALARATSVVEAVSDQLVTVLARCPSPSRPEPVDDRHRGEALRAPPLHIKRVRSPLRRETTMLELAVENASVGIVGQPDERRRAARSAARIPFYREVSNELRRCPPERDAFSATLR
jgi:hypothetical protein